MTTFDILSPFERETVLLEIEIATRDNERVVEEQEADAVRFVLSFADTLAKNFETLSP